MSRELTEEGGELAAEDRVRRLDAFAARALDFSALLSVLERHALTPLGARAVRELAPREDADARRALDRSREMIELARAGRGPNLVGVNDPWPAIQRARRAGRSLLDDELVLLRAFFSALESLRIWLDGKREESPALAQLAVGLPDLVELVERIDSAVDDRGRVRDHASPLLWRLRKEESELSAEIERKLRAYTARPEIKAVLSDPSIHRRGGRAVLVVKAKSSSRVPGIVHDRSQTGESVFIEPREVVALSNRHAECAADERREVERILLEITRVILAHQDAIELSAERVAELELALIAARFARETDARVPSTSVTSATAAANEETTARRATADERGGPRSLLLRSARHPLLVEEKRLGRLQEVVPIDLRLSGDFDLMIITGPNTGGKTLALKTAGLAALLVRCGLPFPCAEGSCVPLYDGVVADIGDEQEIRQSLSTFSSHLVRIKSGLERAGPKTLFLLDELGAGTDPDEGAALSEALLEVLLERRVPTLASTHIGKLKEFAFRHARAENACVEFDAQTLAPRYRLIVGTPGESGALSIARRLGLAESLVDRAEQRLVRRDAEVQRLMAEVRIARTRAEEVRTRAETHLEDVSRATREIEEKRQAIDRRGELLEAEAQRSIEERVREARAQVERARALLAQLPAAQKKAMDEILSALDHELSGSALSDRRQAFLDGLSKGSFVFLPRYRQRVAVQRVDRANREITVQLGKMTMRVSFDEVASYETR
jgi:DNA mismatch repair protein MutS2